MLVYQQKCVPSAAKADNSIDSFLENPYRSDIRFEPIAGQKERKMRKIIFGTSLFIAFIAAGCASSTSSQLHQSLLLQENRQLEDALYVAHSQVTELKRENDLLRSTQETGNVTPIRRSYNGSLEEEFDVVPPYEMPKVILPGQSGTTEVPDALKGSQVMPTWTPRR